MTASVSSTLRILLVCGAVSLAPGACFAADPLSDAITLIDSHRLPEARVILAALVDREPGNAQALWYLGKSDLLMQHREDAVVSLRRAAELLPLDHRVLADYGTACLLRSSELGVSLKSIGFARQGRDSLLKAVELAPDVLAYREGLAAFYRRAPGLVGGSMDKAYAQAAEIARRNPARGAIIKASIQAEEKKYDEARAACEEALRTQPDSYMALYTLGRIASDSGQELARGEQVLRHCLELVPAIQEPDFAGVHYRLGLIAQKDGKLDIARTEYETALKVEPTFDQAAAALAKLNKQAP